MYVGSVMHHRTRAEHSRYRFVICTPTWRNAVSIEGLGEFFITCRFSCRICGYPLVANDRQSIREGAMKLSHPRILTVIAGTTLAMAVGLGTAAASAAVTAPSHDTAATASS